MSDFVEDLNEIVKIALSSSKKIGVEDEIPYLTKGNYLKKDKDDIVVKLSTKLFKIGIIYRHLTNEVIDKIYQAEIITPPYDDINILIEKRGNNLQIAANEIRTIIPKTIVCIDDKSCEKLLKYLRKRLKKRKTLLVSQVVATQPNLTPGAGTKSIDSFLEGYDSLVGSTHYLIAIGSTSPILGYYSFYRAAYLNSLNDLKVGEERWLFSDGTIVKPLCYTKQRAIHYCIDKLLQSKNSKNRYVSNTYTFTVNKYYLFPNVNIKLSRYSMFSNIRIEVRACDYDPKGYCIPISYALAFYPKKFQDLLEFDEEKLIDKTIKTIVEGPSKEDLKNIEELLDRANRIWEIRELINFDEIMKRIEENLINSKKRSNFLFNWL